MAALRRRLLRGNSGDDTDTEPTPTPEPMYNPAESEDYKLFGAWKLYYSGSGLLTSMESEMSIPAEGYPLIVSSATNEDLPYFPFAEVYERYTGREGYYSGFNPDVLGFSLAITLMFA